MIRKSKILSDTLMVRSDVVTSEFACRTGWGCIAIWVQLKNSTVLQIYGVRSTEHAFEWRTIRRRIRLWIQAHSRDLGLLAHEIASGEIIARAVCCLDPRSTVWHRKFDPFCGAVVTRIKRKKISREASLLSPQLNTRSCKPWIVSLSYESTGSYQAFRLETKIKWNDKFFH